MNTKNLLLFLFVVELSTGFASCGNDDDEDTDTIMTNRIVYGEVNAKIVGAKISQQPSGEYSSYNVMLYTEGLSLSATSSPIGSGYVFISNIISIDGSIEGEYTYYTSDEEPEKLTKDIYVANILGHIENSKSSQGEVSYLMSKQITISITKSGEEYDITIKGKDMVGNSLNINYNGRLSFENSTPAG